MELSSKLAVVTGAGSGIGRALAEQLVASGCDVALCDLDAATLGETATRCRGMRPGASVTAVALDVTDSGALAEFAAEVGIAHDTDHVDLLFNNAGVGGGLSFVASSESEWDRTFDVSWGGVYRATRAFLPMLIVSPAATIVNISSLNGVWATLGKGRPVSAYATAKFAVRGFTESLHHDLATYVPNVRATVVIPGGVRTSILANTARLHGRAPLTMTPERLAEERARLIAAHVDLRDVDDAALRRLLLKWQDEFNASATLSADDAATLVLDGVRRGRRRIVIGVGAIALDRASRLLPTRIYDLPNRLLHPVVVMGAPIRAVRVIVNQRRNRRAEAVTGHTGAMTTARSVLITGASTGIGAAAAARLDELGWRVFAGVRRIEDGERLQQASSASLKPVLLDVNDADQVRDALSLIDSELDGAGLDGLVNNAGASFGGPIEIVPLDHWRQQFEVNVVGQVAVTQAALPLVRRAVGRVVFISSLSGRVAGAFNGPYAASKHAVEGLAMSLRKEVGPWGIRVAVIEPGVIDTPIWHKAPDLAEAERLFPHDGLELYRPYLEPIAGFVERQLAAAAPVSAATDAIVHVLTATHPKHRYLVGKDAKLLAPLYRYLPDRAFARAEKVIWRLKR